jgi:hypothetical protein
MPSDRPPLLVSSPTCAFSRYSLPPSSNLTDGFSHKLAKSPTLILPPLIVTVLERRGAFSGPNGKRLSTVFNLGALSSLFASIVRLRQASGTDSFHSLSLHCHALLLARRHRRSRILLALRSLLVLLRPFFAALQVSSVSPSSSSSLLLSPTSPLAPPSTRRSLRSSSTRCRMRRSSLTRGCRKRRQRCELVGRAVEVGV